MVRFRWKYAAEWPMRKPIDIIVDELSSRVRTDLSGARSLAHVMVVVPTAQSGRRLRFKLAERFGALIPPEVRMPAQLVENPDGKAVASRAEEIAAIWEARGGKEPVVSAIQLVGIRDILGAAALSFADVAERVGEIVHGEFVDDEIARWRGFAELEVEYLRRIKARGLIDRIFAMKEILANPPRLEGIEEIVCAYVLDPLPAARMVLETLERRDGLKVEWLMPDEKELENVTVQRERIFASGTVASESAAVAAYFAGVQDGEALPALCMADQEMFPELRGALQSKGFSVHDPSHTRLSTSSLGHLAAQVADLVRTKSYATFSAFVRGGDARQWFVNRLGFSVADVTSALADLDRRQAELLPERIDDIAPKTSGKLRAIFEFVGTQLRKHGMREILRDIFNDRTLNERDAGAREFVSAAGALNDLIDECFGENVPSEIAWELFARRLEETTYSLEPDSGDVVLTDGWLELPYLDADELVICGFCEGCVPESVVGHAFLPDSLRHGLGLPDNESRAKRDLTILRMAVGCRDRLLTRVSFHTLDARGDVTKPSRLLFEGVDDAELIARVRAFYGTSVGTEETHAWDLPSQWKLKLEIPPEKMVLEHASPSSIDTYLRCPFTYFLKRNFGERKDDRAEELDPSEFGKLAHGALEKWGQGALADSEDVGDISAELAANVDALLGERFGTAVPVIVTLQGESLKRRLANFARAQVEWHRSGWRIKATERKLEVKLEHTRLHGRCDRIDYNPQTGQWCVIDYKTWDDAGKRTNSLQLPMYCSMLDADPEFPEARRSLILSAYCIIGKSAQDTGFGKLQSGDEVPEAEDRVKEVIGLIERGIFWPPSGSMEKDKDFGAWFPRAAEECVDEEWIKDQERRLAGVHKEK